MGPASSTPLDPKRLSHRPLTIVDGSENPVIKDDPQYVGITPLLDTVETEKDKETKISKRKCEDGLLIVVPAKTYGK